MTQAAQRLLDLYPSRLVTIDSHTCGEPTRLIMGGLGPIPGRDMKEKRLHFMEHMDPVRLCLTREPRGHRDMVAAALTEPASKGADFGLIYMDAKRYPFLCGHATIGAVTTVLETGALEAREPETTVTVDTPSGPMTARAEVSDGRVGSVSVETVPSFVYGEGGEIRVPGLGQIRVDTVCVGGFFVMVSAAEAGVRLEPEEGRRLTDLGMEIIRCANEQLEVCHPARAEVRTVDVAEFYEENGPRRGRSAVIYGESHLDRSPCGTGTAAKLTLLHHRGELAPGEIYYNSSPLGTTFEARIVRETVVGGMPSVVAEITGSAHVTGVHSFVVAPGDPFGEGFLI